MRLVSICTMVVSLIGVASAHTNMNLVVQNNLRAASCDKKCDGGCIPIGADCCAGGKGYCGGCKGHGGNFDCSHEVCCESRLDGKTYCVDLDNCSLGYIAGEVVENAVDVVNSVSEAGNVICGILGC